MTAYYNEPDRFAAAWLRELITAGHIARGDVDERSIEDVRPTDLAGYTQCHFFAGIGVWSYALRAAGWPDDRPVWTGSCPCQPFSSAGEGEGFADERHLWPAWFHLIGQRRPAKIFGEQVAGKRADPWVDLVQDDLEALGYAFGALPFPSAGVGAPHIRDRLYWHAAGVGLADTSGDGPQGRIHRRPNQGREAIDGSARRGGATLGLALSDLHHRTGRLAQSHGRPALELAGFGAVGGLADADGEPERGEPGSEGTAARGVEVETCGRDGQRDGPVDDRGSAASGRPGPVNGLWRAADWLLCRDGKWRPVEPGTFPLAHGAPARVGRLRGYGNAINAEAAIAFIKACTGK